MKLPLLVSCAKGLAAGLAITYAMRYSLIMDSTRKKRVPIHLDVKVNHVHQAEGLDLSADGMYIYTRHTVIAGAIIDIEVTLEGKAYDIQAKVQHVQPGVGFGVSFMDMPPDMAERLKDMVEGGLH